ncbi:hypothetical protein [Salarchaeum japonicum]|uniref:Uncharacterized protein n=1 Tax=Salarchaeum japonicum TaxID=555573 RepID=A0AAV3T2X4_9EURY|nr:hypothetical protein [Salarchaeum japonicum]
MENTASVLTTAVAVACFAFGLYAYLVLGWRFGGDGNTAGTVIGAAVAVGAVALTLLRR